MNQEQSEILKKALAVDVEIQKAVSAFASHIHDNPNPNYHLLDQLRNQIVKLSGEWEDMLV